MSPPTPIFDIALAVATHPSNSTQWQDERSDVPPIDGQHVPICRIWLEILGSAAACKPSNWQVIKRKWLSFLAATSEYPSIVLSPNRKRSRWEAGPESDVKAIQRFREDQRTRGSIQCAIWRLFDQKEALVERWPHEPRIMMNRSVDSSCKTPFAALMGDFGKQRRFNSVWSSLVCFLLYCHEEEGSLNAMGLKLSEDLENDLFGISQAIVITDYLSLGSTGVQTIVEQEIRTFVFHMLTDTSAYPTTNPLLWWATILVRSSLENGQKDLISRGHFSLNILPMDLSIEQRLEAILHFAKVFLLDLAFDTWEPVPKTQLLEVQDDLNRVDNTWIGPQSSFRPTQGPDERTCETAAWESVLDHVEKTLTKYLRQSHGTPMCQILLLRDELMKPGHT